ncbi:unnamed protein product, partial [Chrysoparadoxa australica]
EVPHNRWDVDAYYDSDPGSPGKTYARAGGFVNGLELFDNTFFSISAAEAQGMDPQQRLLLEVGYEALHGAGYTKASLAGSNIGVFVGACTNDWNHLASTFTDSIGTYTGTGGAASILANRLSYLLGLHGPSMTIDTACSSSLVALDLAMQSLQLGGCSAALVIGVNLMLSPATFEVFSKARMLSPDGRCATFDVSANGYARGEGCGAIVLKRLSACEDDSVLAVVRGSAVAHNGRSASLTAPNGVSQQMAIRQALDQAGVEPHEVSYVEAHGTGTALGDPIEVGALKAVYRWERGEESPLVVGALKTNIGHLEGAAGIAGLIKAVLVLQHQAAPPNLHFRKLNPAIDVEGFPVVFPTMGGLTSLEGSGTYAGVSSFGFGGANAHVLLERGSSLLANTDEMKVGALYSTRQSFPWREPSHLLLQHQTEDMVGGEKVSVFSCDFGPRLMTLLSHHVIKGMTIIPGAAYIEAAAGAVCSQTRTSRVVLQRLQFMMPIEAPSVANAVAAGGAAIHASGFDTVLAESGKFEIRAGSDQALVAMGSGKCMPASLLPPKAEPLASIRERCTDAVTSDDFYKAYEQVGLSYGPRFQRVQSVAVGSSEALVNIQAFDPAVCASWEQGGFIMHPAILDCVLQSVGALMLRGDHAGGIFIPAGVDQVAVWNASKHAAVWAHSKLVSVGENKIVADITVTGADGAEVIIELKHFTAMRARGLEMVKPPVPQSPVYSLDWEKVEVDVCREPDAAEAVLVLGRGVTPVDALGSDWHTNVHVSLSKADDLGSLHESAWTKVVFDLSYHMESCATSCEESLEWLLSLLQSLAADGSSTTALYLVTRGVMDVPDNDASPEACSSPEDWRRSWTLGFMRSARCEYPGLSLYHIDVDGTALPAVVKTVLRHSQYLADETEVAICDGSWYVPRLLRQAQKVGPPPGPFAVDLVERGALTNLECRPFTASDRQQPGESEVEVCIRAAALNFRDVLNVMGLYPGDPGPPVFEFSGVVVGVGPSATETWQVGDAVYGISSAGTGCMRSYITTSVATLSAIPKNLSFEEAAASPTVFRTVLLALRDLAGLKAGEKVLIHAASGGVGLAAIQYAHSVGAEVYATAGSVKKCDYLRSVGVKHISSSRDAAVFAAEMRELVGSGKVDVVLNSLSEGFIPESLALLGPGGRFLEIGKRGIWTADEMQAARPDVMYETIALDAQIAEEPLVFREGLEELTGLMESGKLASLPLRVFDAAEEVVEAFTFLQRARHIGKVVLSNRRALQVHKAATYIISGGLGALGLVLARQMLTEGAGHLVLLSRSGLPKEDAVELLQDVQQLSSGVSTVACDVSDAEQVKRLATVLKDLPPVRGIVHAAGVLDDALLKNQSAERFSRVFGPKVEGGWNLHQLSVSEGWQLEFFIGYSSISGALGSPGQSNYAAANTCLDGLMRYRRSLDLPGTSIQWGPWSEVGMAARLSEEAQQGMSLSGMSGISVESAGSLLGLLASGSLSQAVVAEVDWQVYKQLFPNPVLGHVTGDAGSEGASGFDSAAIRREVEGMSPENRLMYLTTAVLDVAREIAENPDLSADEALMEAGMDSLAVVESGNRLRRRFALTGGSFPPTLIFDYPTARSLAGYFDTKMFSSDSATPVVRSRIGALASSRTDGIAMTSMACRLPGHADNPNQLWDSLVAEVD